jgi:hypothetical protein
MVPDAESTWLRNHQRKEGARSDPRAGERRERTRRIITESV